MPTAEYSSAGKTFSMSRWAMMLPIVARRSPAITTPPGKVAATIVVPCGARSPAWPCGTARRAGSRSGACSARKSANDDVPGRQERRRQPPGRRTSSSSLPALLDERLHEVLGVGLEHVVDLVEDRVDVVVERLPCARRRRSRARPRSTSSVSRRTCAAASAPVPCLLLRSVPTAVDAAGSRTASRDPSSAGRARANSVLGGVAAVEQRPDVGLACRAAGRASGPAGATRGRAGRRSPSPRRRRRRGRRTSPGSGRGSRPGCRPAASCIGPLDLVVGRAAARSGRSRTSRW